jgi:hypothetical protein
MAEGARTPESLDKITDQFFGKGSVSAFNRIDSGHINETWHVQTLNENKGYVLQWINHHVFRDVPGLMSNMDRVTKHLKRKLTGPEFAGSGFTTTELIPTKDGRLFFVDDEGNYWRLMTFIDGAMSHETVANPSLAYEGGRAFALFARLTEDLQAQDLTETIPLFHHIGSRLNMFRDAVIRDPEGRVAGVSREIRFVEDRAREMHRILELGEQKRIPVRVTHNDTKFNNILFDRSGKACSIIDLDTVMPGYILYDFGDAIRTGTNNAAEDEPDLTRVSLNMELFEAYTHGYLSAGLSLTQDEIGHLAFSARFMTYIIGLRFLTDHINGDHYYRIHRPGHNLDRARVQFRLVESIEQNLETMQKIVSS